MPLPRAEGYMEFAERVRCLCALYDCSVTSGIRTRQRNTAVGGARHSKHLLHYGGMAADLVPDDNTAARRAEVTTAARRMGLWAKDEVDHVHVHGKVISPV